MPKIYYFFFFIGALFMILIFLRISLKHREIKIWKYESGLIDKVQALYDSAITEEKRTGTMVSVLASDYAPFYEVKHKIWRQNGFIWFCPVKFEKKDISTLKKRRKLINKDRNYHKYISLMERVDRTGIQVIQIHLDYVDYICRVSELPAGNKAAAGIKNRKCAAMQFYDKTTDTVHYTVMEEKNYDTLMNLIPEKEKSRVGEIPKDRTKRESEQIVRSSSKLKETDDAEITQSLEELEALHDTGSITEDEYQSKKRAIEARDISKEFDE